MMIGRRLANVTIVGHSFVARLLTQLENDNGDINNFGIRRSLANVSFIAEGGQKMKHFTKENISAFNPDIAYFEMGLNE